MKQLGHFTFERKERASSLQEGKPPVFGVDRSTGLTPSAKYKSKDISRYKVISQGMFAYNPMRLNIGSIAYSTPTHPTGLVSPDYVVFSCDPEKLDHAYMKYVIEGPAWKKWTANAGVGSVRVRIYYKELAEMPFDPPPLPEQKAIAHILGTLDDKIELNRRMNATLEGMAQALFKSWFVDFDPVIDNALAAGNPIPDELAPRAEVRKNELASNQTSLSAEASAKAGFPAAFEFNDEMGWIPEGWTVSKLKDCTTKIGSGSTPRGGSSAYVESGTRLVRSQNIHDSSFTWSGMVCITDDAAEKLKGVTLTKRDVLINITGDSILRTCIVDPAVLPARVNQHVAILRPAENLPPQYMHQYIVREEYKEYLLGFDAGGSRAAITKGHLEEAEIVIPNDNALAEYARLTNSFVDTQNRNEASSKTLTNLRDTLLPRLISGELSVTNKE